MKYDHLLMHGGIGMLMTAADVLPQLKPVIGQQWKLDLNAQRYCRFPINFQHGEYRLKRSLSGKCL